jgi:hypothetical protein
VTLSDVDHNIDIEHLANGCIYCTEHCAWIVSLTQICCSAVQYAGGYCKCCKQLCKSSRLACFDDLDQAQACRGAKPQRHGVTAFWEHNALSWESTSMH